MHAARHAAPSPRPLRRLRGGGGELRARRCIIAAPTVTSEASRPSLPCCRGRDRLLGRDAVAPGSQGEGSPRRERAHPRATAPDTAAEDTAAARTAAAGPPAAARGWTGAGRAGGRP